MSEKKYQILAYVGSCIAIVLWIVFLYFNPYSSDPGSHAMQPGQRAAWSGVVPSSETGQAFTSRTTITAAVMIASAILGIIAAALRSHVVMYVLFAVQFLPIGVYVLFSPGLFSAIGMGNIGYLVAAIGIHRQRRKDGRAIERGVC